MRNFILSLLLLMTAPLVQANVEPWGDRNILYIAFNSTFVPPSVAKLYDIERSRYRALLNISLMKKGTQIEALPATVSGVARNLLGNRVELQFKEVREENAIYYIAPLTFSNEEMFRFDITVTDSDGRSKQVKFEQKFYAD